MVFQHAHARNVEGEMQAREVPVAIARHKSALNDAQPCTAGAGAEITGR